MLKKISSLLMIFALAINMFLPYADAGSKSSGSSGRSSSSSSSGRSSSSSSRSSGSSMSRPSSSSSSSYKPSSSSVSKPSISSPSKSSSSAKPGFTPYTPKPATITPSTQKPSTVNVAPQVAKPSSTAVTQPKATAPPITTSAAIKRTPAQEAAYTRAKENGTVFSSKADAEAKFKAEKAKTYVSTYKSEPAVRPAHIPATTTVNNKTVNVTYNQSRGGYGYYNDLGTWMMYDALSDAVMMSSLMHRDHYYVNQPTMVMTNTGSYASVPSTTVVYTSGWSYFGYFLMTIIIVSVFAVIIRKILSA